jgi:hypothetical protein
VPEHNKTSKNGETRAGGKLGNICLKSEALEKKVRMKRMSILIFVLAVVGPGTFPKGRKAMANTHYHGCERGSA